MQEIARVDGIEMAYCRFGEGPRIFVILPGLSIKSVVHDQSGEHCYLSRQLCIADKFKLMV